jgi:hypothetical protein
MKHNVFDELNGLYAGDESDELNGLFKKLKKGLSKVAKKAREHRRKIDKKLKKFTPKPLRKVKDKLRSVGRKLDKKGITKVAGAIAIGWIAGPAVFAGLKGAGGMIASKVGAGAVKLGVKGGVKGIIGAVGKKGVASTLVKTGIKYKMSRDQEKAQIKAMQAQEHQAEQLAQHQAQVSENLAAAAGQSPEFAQAINELRAQGYSDEAILQHWVESKSFYMAAVENVAKTIYPQTRSAIIQEGFSPSDATSIAHVESMRIAEEEVKKVQQSFDAKALLPIAAIAATIILGA